MALVIVFHEVADPEQWFEIWREGGPRRQMLATAGATTVHTFHDPLEPHKTGLLIDVADEDEFLALVGSDIIVSTMREDGVKRSSFQLLVEFAS